MAAFTTVFGISAKRLNSLKNSATGLVQPRLSQIGHSSSANKTSITIETAVRNQIASFPARESHYSRAKNKKFKFLDSDLNCVKLWELYTEKHPDLPVSYRIYFNIFKRDFNIKFGYPRSDKCETCDHYKKRKSELSRSENQDELTRITIETDLHKLNGDAFYDAMKEKRELAQSDSSHVALCFDFQKNLPLPLTNVGPEYYKRQLWVHNFNVHNMATDEATMFMYGEHFALKTPNEVISCLDFYLERCLRQNARFLHLFCDNCFGQNKNRYVFLFLRNLVISGKFEKVYINFPVPGHSFMACDRDFATIEKCRRKKGLFKTYLLINNCAR